MEDRQTSSSRYRYSAWDGSQDGAIIPPADLLTLLSDDLLAGDIDRALDRALHRGLSVDDIDALGLDDLRDMLRQQRRELIEAIANDPELQRLVDQLQKQGGTQGLDADLSRLLDALTANAPSAARMISSLDADQRFPLDAALRERLADSTRQLDSDDINLSLGGDGQGLLQQLARLSALDDLEQQVRRVRRVEDVHAVDDQLIRQVLGDHAADGFQLMTASLQAFTDSGYLRGGAGQRQLSARAIRIIGDELLAKTLERISAHRSGDRRTPAIGQHELTGASRPYRFGDPLTLDLGSTVMQAVRRGAGVPVALTAADFTVFEREDSSRAATMLAIDLSRSMGERGYLLAAKQLALGLSSLVRQRYPRDELLLAGFSDTARQLTLAELPALNWDRYGMGTNIQDAMRLARTTLATHRGIQRTLILLTDGEPTAHRDQEGRVHFHQPPGPEALTATYAEAHRLSRDGIHLVVCVLSQYFQVVTFAQELTRRAAGDLIITSPDELSEALTLRFGQSR